MPCTHLGTISEFSAYRVFPYPSVEHVVGEWASAFGHSFVTRNIVFRERY